MSLPGIGEFQAVCSMRNREKGSIFMSGTPIQAAVIVSTSMGFATELNRMEPGRWASRGETGGGVMKFFLVRNGYTFLTLRPRWWAPGDFTTIRITWRETSIWVCSAV